MEIRNEKYLSYVNILKSELVPAMGCTEPIAVAYAAAKASEILEEAPVSASIGLSGNIVKNIKSVAVPCTGGLRGIKASVLGGLVSGRADLELEVLSAIDDPGREKLRSMMESFPLETSQADTEHVVYIDVRLNGRTSRSRVLITGSHTNIVCIEKNGEAVFQARQDTFSDQAEDDVLTVEEILEFAGILLIEDVEDTIKRQITFNTAVSQEGFKGNYGASIGSTLRSAYGDDIKNKARAAAAAGSDARMSGCEKPVIILAGSGNQGLTASLPVIEYARHLGSSEEELIRALVVSSLITVHLKSGIGRLSAYCGAVSAGAAAGAGIAYLNGGGMRDVAHTLVNALAITSGIVCDGAKPSCAAKISASVDAGILGYEMFKSGRQFYDGDGIVSKGVENTIKNISRLGKDGMKGTDREIISIMLE